MQKKNLVLKMLRNMEDVVRKLSDDVRYRRFFLVDDGQGIIIEDGIWKAAEILGKTVEAVPGFGAFEFSRITCGTLSIFQISHEEKRQ